MRGLTSVDEPGAQAGPFRVCADCHRAKTIRGVWYLVPGRGDVPFVCEACFGAPRVASALI